MVEFSAGGLQISEKLFILEILYKLFHFELCALRWSIDRLRVLMNGKKKENYVVNFFRIIVWQICSNMA